MNERQLTRFAALAVTGAVGLGTAACTSARTLDSRTPSSPEARAGVTTTVTTTVVSACSTDDLKAAVEPRDAGAGSRFYEISLTNTGSEPCRVSGYPGVSVVGHGDGTQLGQDARRSGDAGEATVLIPGAHAVATLQAVNIGTDGGPLGGECDAVAADGWRIYPPDSRESVFVQQQGLTACRSDAEWLTISGMHPVS